MPSSPACPALRGNSAGYFALRECGAQPLDTGIGDLGLFQVQPQQALHIRQNVEGAVVDFGRLPESQLLQLVKVFQYRKPFRGDGGLAQIERPEFG